MRDPLFEMDDRKKLFADFEKNAFPHIDALYNFGLRATGNEKFAGKLLTEAYRRAFRFFDKLEVDTNIKSWLFRIMLNIFFNEYSNQNKKTVEFDFEDTEQIFIKIKESISDISQIEKETSLKLKSKELSEIFSFLPEDLKIVLILCDIEKFSYEEISDFIDIPVEIVKSRIQRARKIIFINLYRLIEKKNSY